MRLFALALLTLSFVCSATADDMILAQAKKGAKVSKKEEKPKEKLALGVIASYGNFRQTASTSVDTSANEVGGNPSPIGGSISRNGRDCAVSISNNSEENTYSLRFSVEAQTKTGARQSARSFSATLKPGGSTTKTIRCEADWNMAVILKSGRAV